jgi:hypothetical protein
MLALIVGIFNADGSNTVGREEKEEVPAGSPLAADDTPSRISIPTLPPSTDDDEDEAMSAPLPTFIVVLIDVFVSTSGSARRTAVSARSAACWRVFNAMLPAARECNCGEEGNTGGKAKEAEREEADEAEGATKGAAAADASTDAFRENCADAIALCSPNDLAVENPAIPAAPLGLRLLLLPLFLLLLLLALGENPASTPSRDPAPPTMLLLLVPNPPPPDPDPPSTSIITEAGESLPDASALLGERRKAGVAWPARLLVALLAPGPPIPSLLCDAPAKKPLDGTPLPFLHLFPLLPQIQNLLHLPNWKQAH